MLTQIVAVVFIEEFKVPHSSRQPIYVRKKMRERGEEVILHSKHSFTSSHRTFTPEPTEAESMCMNT